MQLHKQLKGAALLMIAALIWGTAFAAQSAGMDYIQPFTFNAVRSYIGFSFLMPLYFLTRKKAGKWKTMAETEGSRRKNKKTILLGGIVCGGILCVSGMFQQIGIQYTSVGKAGFFTALYIVIVPILGLFVGKKLRFTVWISVFAALLGVYLLGVKSGLNIEPGDLLIIACAFFFSFHIMAIEYFAVRMNGILLSAMQFFVVAVLSTIGMFMFESPNVEAILAAWFPLVYTGVFSSGIAYTLQIVGQRTVNAAVAPVIMSMESVFAALSGWIIFQEILSGRETIGCVLVFAAVILAQIPEKKKDICIAD